MILYFCIGLTCTIALAIFGNHIGGNKVLSRNSRRNFAFSAELLALACLLESSTAIWEGRPQFRILYTILLAVGLTIPHFYCTFQCFACDNKRLGKISAIITTFYTLFVIISIPFGWIYRINEAGHYEIGSLLILNYLVLIVLLGITFTMLYQLSADANNRDLRTLFNVAAIIICGYTGSFIAQSDIISFVGTSLSFLIIYSYYSSLKQQELQRRIEEKQKLAEQLSLETMQALTGALDAKDRYSNGHSYRVSEYSVKLARHLGWDEDRIQDLRYASLMHDIGKIGIPDAVLNKGGRLTDTEFAMMKAHTTLGSEITLRINSAPNGYSAARYHHERFDGRGYPDALKGTEIPEIARLIAIADTFDAMNSDRIYRLALPKEVIREELLRGSGTQFDPDFLQAFVEVYDSGELDEIGMTARRDMSKLPDDDIFASTAQDILECFTVGFEFTGHWDEYYTRWNQFDHFLKTLCADNQIPFTLASISIVPKSDAVVSNEKQQEAIDLMIKAIQNVIQKENVCGQISQKEVSVILRTEEPRQIREAMQGVFLYFYKIFDAAPFTVSYDLRGGSHTAES